MTSVLFVCTGNICRSPTAEAIFRNLTRESGLDCYVDSAGTHGYHTGEGPDHRTVRVAKERGVDMSGLAARQFVAEDLDRFDFVIAMDKSHLKFMENMAAGAGGIGNVSLFLDHMKEYEGLDVPDPYYGSIQDFESVYDLIKDGADSLLDYVKASSHANKVEKI